MFTVHVRVNDASTGRPTPVRLRLVDASGRYCPPLGRLADFATEPGTEVGDQVRIDGAEFAYIDGSCEVPLPAGNVSVQISKGPEYRPVEQTVSLASGQMALRFTIERWTDWRERRWYAGDMRVHDLTPHSALLEGAAEGLSVVQLLARQKIGGADAPSSIRNMTAFSGMQAALSSADCLVAVNTLNVHATLGRVALLNCHRPVYPLVSGAPGLDDWSVADWCDQCHRKKGLVVWPIDDGGESLASLILGKIDACEIGLLSDPRTDTLALYYRFLNCGFRPGLVAGSGKDSNGVAMGTVRTYARFDEGVSLAPDTWIEAVRGGRTFITSGPLLTLQVAGRDPGAVVSVEAGRPVRIRAEASSATAFDRLEIVAERNILATQKQAEEGHSATLEIEWPFEQGTWIAARCFAEDGSRLVAHTSPVWLEIPGVPLQPLPQTIEPLLAQLDAALAWINASACVPTERHREHYRETIQLAQQELLSRLAADGEGLSR